MPTRRRAVASVPPPTLTLQINALQAMCRQVFGFRLAMIAIGAPFALAGAAKGAPGLLVGAAVLGTFMGSYVLFRDWERFGPLLLRHPWLLAVDAVFGALLLITATPESPSATSRSAPRCSPAWCTAGGARASSRASR